MVVILRVMRTLAWSASQELPRSQVCYEDAITRNPATQLALEYATFSVHIVCES